jgi:hypothetical protein
MGSEVLCTVRSGGKESRGKALLETSEIVFRGDFRLKIPFSALRSTLAKDGELHLKWSEGDAVFELGERAAKWADKILHPKGTAEKLGIKPGQVVSVRAISDGPFLRDLQKQATKLSKTKLLKDSDLIFFGASESADLGSIGDLVPFLASAGALWIVYPKGKQEIRETDVLAAGRAAGLTDVKVVKFSESHTALKFVRPKSKR